MFTFDLENTNTFLTTLTAFPPPLPKAQPLFPRVLFLIIAIIVITIIIATNSTIATTTIISALVLRVSHVRHVQLSPSDRFEQEWNRAHAESDGNAQKDFFLIRGRLFHLIILFRRVITERSNEAMRL